MPNAMEPETLLRHSCRGSQTVPVACRPEVVQMVRMQSWRMLLRQPALVTEMKSFCIIRGQWVGAGAALKTHIRIAHADVWKCKDLAAQKCLQTGFISCSPCHYCGQKTKTPVNISEVVWYCSRLLSHQCGPRPYPRMTEPSSVANEEMAMLLGMSRGNPETKTREEEDTAERPAKYHHGSGKGPSQSQKSQWEQEKTGKAKQASYWRQWNKDPGKAPRKPKTTRGGRGAEGDGKAPDEDRPKKKGRDGLREIGYGVYDLRRYWRPQAHQPGMADGQSWRDEGAGESSNVTEVTLFLALLQALQEK